jgi:hypothetical protein
MEKFIYLSTAPEALIGSMLPPAEFGHYMATGTKKCNKSQMIFFELDYDQVKSMFNYDYFISKCVKKADGSPKSSVYLSIYRVLEFIPLSALKSLYITSDHGHVLRLQYKKYDESIMTKKEMHLYQELCPVTPQVASNLTPLEFLKKLTDGSLQIRLPKLLFVDLKLGDLANDPLKGSAEHLPYGSVSHLRDCLEIIKTEDLKQMKTVHRSFTGTLLYRTIDCGFFIGSKDNILYYPFPSLAEIEKSNYEFYKDI